MQAVRTRNRWRTDSKGPLSRASRRAGRRRRVLVRRAVDDRGAGRRRFNHDARAPCRGVTARRTKLMNGTLPPFGVNTYSYSQRWTAEDCVRSLADQGYASVELMMYPGHLWPAEADAARRRSLRRLWETSGLRLITINSPNIDLNIAAACREMREHT